MKSGRIIKEKEKWKKKNLGDKGRKKTEKIIQRKEKRWRILKKRKKMKDSQMEALEEKSTKL